MCQISINVFLWGHGWSLINNYSDKYTYCQDSKISLVGITNITQISHRKLLYKTLNSLMDDIIFKALHSLDTITSNSKPNYIIINN